MTTKKVSAKSVIESGIAGGKTVKFILGQIEKKCEGSKADESHIRFYANKMLRAGTLSEEVAQAKYGCGKRGRKAAEKPENKKTSTSKKAPVSNARAKTTGKKTAAPKKSGNAARGKTSAKANSSSKK